jgi:hypothetical protein
MKVAPAKLNNSIPFYNPDPEPHVLDRGILSEPLQYYINHIIRHNKLRNERLCFELTD